jgi:hypothetical protein
VAAPAGTRRASFGAADLLLADSRLAFSVLNEVRYRALGRVFGVSREQANLLTGVLLLMGGHEAVVVTGKVVRWRPPISGSDVVMGGFTAREAAVGMAGPSASAVSPFATLVAIALAGGLAVPTIRRAARTLRVTEHRVRMWRERSYATARDAMRGYGVASGAADSSTMLRWARV